MAESTSDKDPMKREVGSMTVGELLDLLRRVGGGEVSSSGPESSGEGSREAAMREAVEAFNAKSMSERVKRMAVVEMVGSSPPSIQIDFLKGLAESEEARKEFMEDPVGFSKNAGVLLDERVVTAAVDAAVFDRGIDKAIVDKIGIDAATKLGDLRNPGVAAWPAAVAAIAAVVAAGAAVVQAATAVMKDHSAGDLMRLKGLGPHGIRLPQGGAAMIAENGAAGGRGALMTGAAATGAAFVASGGGMPGGALGGRQF